MLNHAQISRVENKRAALILLNGKILSGSGLLHDRVFPPAGMRAGSMIGIPSCKIVGQQASPRIGNAHRAVYKGLNLQILRGFLPDLTYFRKTQLSCADHTPGPHSVPEAKGSGVGIVRLRRDVNLQIRAVLLCKIEHSGICNQNRVRAQLLQLTEVRRCTCKIRVMRQNIRCDMHPRAMRMRILNSLCHFLRREISCLCPEAIGLSADVDGIRTEIHRGFQNFKILGWTQKLRLFPGQVLFHKRYPLI